MQAAVGVEQLKKFPEFIEKRKKNWEYFRDQLIEKEMERYFVLPEAAANSSPSWFGFLLTVKEAAGKTRNDITAYLEAHNIQTRLLFSGNFTKHPCFAGLCNEKDYRIVSDLKNTDTVMNRSFWIGVYPGMTKEMMNFMVEKLTEALK